MERVSTTFWNDFGCADCFGVKAIKDTYNRAFSEWKSRYEYLTELVIVLNHKIWQHCEHGNQTYAALYNQLWQQADGYAMEHLSGKELEFFLAVTD